MTSTSQRDQWTKLCNELKRLTGWKFDLVDGYSLDCLVTQLPGVNLFHSLRYKSTVLHHTYSAWIDSPYLREVADTPAIAVMKLAIKVSKKGLLS